MTTIRIIAVQHESHIDYHKRGVNEGSTKTFIHYLDSSKPLAEQAQGIFKHHVDHMDWDYCNDQTQRPSYVKHVLPVLKSLRVNTVEDLGDAMEKLCHAFKAYWNEHNEDSPCMGLWCSVDIHDMKPGDSWFLDA